MAANSVGQLRAIADHPVSDADQHQGCLLLSGLHRYETHRRPAHCLTKRFGVGCVVFVSLNIWLDQLGRDQLHRMPKRLQQPRAMMARTAGFDRDHRRRELREERHHILAP
jgi:hypothetical protein